MTMRTTRWLIGLAAAPYALLAQAPSSQAPAAAAEPMPEAQQITAAILPLPKEFRDDAAVLGYRAGASGLVTLRKGAGSFVCLATDPAATQFHVACYHRSLEPFMARGRALRAQGTKGEQVDTVRFKEIKSGKLAFPKGPAALYTLTGPAGSFDPATGTAPAARLLSVVYISGATPASTGLTAQPIVGAPWIMYPGTPKAHIMLVPKM
jgi:hypothetical protein